MGTALSIFRQQSFATSLNPDECYQRIQSALTSWIRMYGFIPGWKGEWPVSGRVRANGFQLRTRTPWSNGSSVIWAIGRCYLETGKTRVVFRFLPDALATVGLILMVVVDGVLWTRSSLLALILLAFIALVLVGGLASARVEQRRLTRFLLSRVNVE